MRTILVLMLSSVLLTTVALAETPRFVIDDDEYLSKVTETGTCLAQQDKLVPLETLRAEIQTKGCRVKLAAPSRHKLTAPEVYERLRAGTLAVGMLYKCPDCGDWHFNSSAGFVVGQGGIVCTCCHVVLEQDPAVKQSYLIAADAAGQVFPVRAVLAADTEADTCFLRIDAPHLKPLPLRLNARTGERVYCLSHPGGYFFMFTQGMVARVSRQCNDVLDAHGKSNGEFTRPILFLNVTAEFAPGSSGAPIADEDGNVVAQVASIADAGEPDVGDDDIAPSPSVAVRFCTASEEIMRLADPKLRQESKVQHPKPVTLDAGGSRKLH